MSVTLNDLNRIRWNCIQSIFPGQLYIMRKCLGTFKMTKYRFGRIIILIPILKLLNNYYKYLLYKKIRIKTHFYLDIIN